MKEPGQIADLMRNSGKTQHQQAAHIWKAHHKGPLAWLTA